MPRAAASLQVVDGALANDFGPVGRTMAANFGHQFDSSAGQTTTDPGPLAHVIRVIIVYS